MPSLAQQPAMPAPRAESAPADWFAEAPRSSETPDLPAWYRELQDQAWSDFLATPAPTRFDESWRFADLKKPRFAGLQCLRPEVDTDALVARATADLPEEYAAHYVFANNGLIHSEVRGLPEKAVCLPFNEALARHGELVRAHFLREKSHLGGEKFARLHASATLSGLFVHFPDGCAAKAPVVVHHFAGGAGEDIVPVFPHTLVVAEGRAEVTVMDHFESISEGDASLAVGMADLVADTGAHLQYVALQDFSDSGAKHVQLNSTRVGRDAAVKSAFLNLGAAWARNESINRMTETGADSRILGAALATGRQEYDQRTLQSHEAQHTTSDLLFKNALYDEARTIFGGLIQVQPGAHHTDSFQTCRNLLGSDKAEANSMPGLEIDADQVRCSHGATSGQISEEEIFYLQARGIPAERARRMISFGFLNEAVTRLEGEALVARLSRKLDEKFRELG